MNRFEAISRKMSRSDLENEINHKWDCTEEQWNAYNDEIARRNQAEGICLVSCEPNREN